MFMLPRSAGTTNTFLKFLKNYGGDYETNCDIIIIIINLKIQIPEEKAICKKPQDTF